MTTVSKFADFPVNSFVKYDAAKDEWVPKYAGNPVEWRTRNVTTELPDSGLRIGRIDHFMKGSIKAIVAACVKQVVNREGMEGVHTITIELATEGAKPQSKTLTILVTA